MQPAQLSAWIGAAGGRRFLLTLGAGVVHTALLCAGVITEQTYLTLTLGTVAAYITANTIQKVKQNASS